ncbi:hypothetical protein C8R44DRAFT_890438 [Mycena epipterygia]|nr:hypothetical protein C8R44DRAFT_890438 [Mycena epipterygia]
MRTISSITIILDLASIATLVCCSQHSSFEARCHPRPSKRGSQTHPPPPGGKERDEYRCPKPTPRRACAAVTLRRSRHIPVLARQPKYRTPPPGGEKRAEYRCPKPKPPEPAPPSPSADPATFSRVNRGTELVDDPIDSSYSQISTAPGWARDEEGMPWKRDEGSAVFTQAATAHEKAFHGVMV